MLPLLRLNDLSTWQENFILETLIKEMGEIEVREGNADENWGLHRIMLLSQSSILFILQLGLNMKGIGG